MTRAASAIIIFTVDAREMPLERPNNSHVKLRKCRNWQTSKTKDLVPDNGVWVQVPLSARGNVGIGRRARLRILCQVMACGFKSHFPQLGLQIAVGVCRRPFFILNKGCRCRCGTLCYYRRLRFLMSSRRRTCIACSKWPWQTS